MPEYSLSEPLPQDVFANVAGPLGGYRGYPTYSLQWFWRRTAVFAPLAATVGLLQATLIAIELRDTRLGFLCAAVGAPIWMAIVTAGPAFATLVRHRRLPQPWERVAIVVAILAGLAVSCFGQYLAGVFSRAVVAPRYQAYFSGPHYQHPEPILVVVVWALIGALFFCLGGGVALRTYFREQRSWRDARQARELDLLRRQKNEADLRLTVLQAQVEPHFLFNTLASIHSLVRQDPARAEATIEALVDHLRVTMPKFRAEIGSTGSTLAQQIEVCESYLAVMKVRMGQRLRFTVDVPTPLRSHPFPPLMLISLAENAIKHGLEPSAAGGNIVLSAATEVHAERMQLAVSVTDDGAGLQPDAGGGVGLNNIREQLSARFGSEGALLIRGRTVGGVAATIRVPYSESNS